MATIHIIVGSVMGTAQSIAEQAQAFLDANHLVKINPSFTAGDISPNEALLICTSNTGVGDLPSNIAPLLVHLMNDYPAIAGQKYGLINLGDSHYPSYTEGGKKLDAALADLGAINTLTPLVFDASEGDPSIGELRMWLKEWEATL